MLARDIMSSPAVTVAATLAVTTIAAMLRDRRISGVPVVDGDKLVGIITESDLTHRYEIGTDRVADLRPWWRRFHLRQSGVRSYIKSHGRTARHVMSAPVHCVPEDAPISEVAGLLHAHRIGRVPVMAGPALVGMITRADLVKTLAREPARTAAAAIDDEAIRGRLLDELAAQPWWNRTWQNVYVVHGVVVFKGAVESEEHRLASRVAAETVPGVRGIQDDRVLATDVPMMI